MEDDGEWGSLIEAVTGTPSTKPKVTKPEVPAAVNLVGKAPQKKAEPEGKAPQKKAESEAGRPKKAEPEAGRQKKATNGTSGKPGEKKGERQ